MIVINAKIFISSNFLIKIFSKYDNEIVWKKFKEFYDDSDYSLIENLDKMRTLY